MDNGNTFINEGPKGRFFEVNPDGDILWEYLNPYRGNIHHPDGDPKKASPFTYWQFRATFIPADHLGLKGKDLHSFTKGMESDIKEDEKDMEEVTGASSSGAYSSPFGGEYKPKKTKPVKKKRGRPKKTK